MDLTFFHSLENCFVFVDFSGIKSNYCRFFSRVYVKNLKACQTIVYTVYDKEENELAKIESADQKVTFEIKDAAVSLCKMDDPKQGDYTEEYQAYYHEELIKQLFSRKYLWA